MTKVAEWLAGWQCIRLEGDRHVHIVRFLDVVTFCGYFFGNKTRVAWPPDCPRCIAAIEKEMKANGAG